MENLLNKPFFQPYIGIINCSRELDQDIITNPNNKVLSYYCLKYLQKTIRESFVSYASSEEWNLLEEDERDDILVNLNHYFDKLIVDIQNKMKSLKVTEDEAIYIVERFADDQYNEALLQHQSGTANLVTASKYYNSKIFYDILLKQLYDGKPLSEDRQNKQRVAAERSISITNDINCGKKPLRILSADEKLAAQKGLPVELYKMMTSIEQEMVIASINTQLMIEIHNLKASRDKIPDFRVKMKEAKGRNDKKLEDACKNNNIPEYKRIKPKSVYDIKQQILELISAIDDRINYLDNVCLDMDEAELCEQTKGDVQKLLSIANKIIEDLPIDTSPSSAPTSPTKDIFLEREDELSSFLQQCSLPSPVAKLRARALVNSKGVDLKAIISMHSKNELRAFLPEAGVHEQEALSIISHLNASTYNFAFTKGSQTIVIDNVFKLSEKLNNCSDSSLEGIYSGTFTSFDKYHVIVKQTLRFRDITHEASILKHLKDSSVSGASTGCIEMYGVNTEQSPSFIVLEEFGESLALYLHTNHQTTFQFKRAILKQILESVEALHRSSVMHGDIKPHNVLVKELRGGIVATKLCDLDSARIINSSDTLFPYDHETKRLKFSPLWVSPEVWKNSEAQKGGTFQAALSIDIFSLGLLGVLLECKDNLFHNGYVLPDTDTADYKQGFCDQEFLQKRILRVNSEDPIIDLLHNMCSIESSDRKPISAIVREYSEQFDTTKIHQVKKQLKKEIQDGDNLSKVINDNFKKLTMELNELKSEFKSGFSIIKNTIKNVADRTHPTTFVLLDMEQIEKPKSEEDDSLMLMSMSIVNRMKGFAEAMMSPAETIKDAIKSALREEEYLSLVCEVCRKPQAGPDGRYCYKISHPKAVKFIGKILPLARVGLKVALMINTVSSVGRVFGLPTPVLKDETFSSMSSYLNDIQKDDLDAFENLQDKIQKAYSNDKECPSSNNVRDDSQACLGGEGSRQQISMSEGYSMGEFIRFLDEVDPHKNWKKLLERNVNDEGEVFFACSMCSINMKK